jgi:hypothetical protein
VRRGEPHSPYCRVHRPSLDQRQLSASKSREARGYGSTHKAARERYAALVASGLAMCARCGQPILAGAQFDLDHDDGRGGYIGVSHPTCNRRAGAQVTNGKVRARGNGAGDPFAGKRIVSENWWAPNPPPPGVVVLGEAERVT